MRTGRMAKPKLSEFVARDAFWSRKAVAAVAADAGYLGKMSISEGDPVLDGTVFASAKRS